MRPFWQYNNIQQPFRTDKARLPLSVEASLLFDAAHRFVGVAVGFGQSYINAKADNVLKVAYWLLIIKRELTENQMINNQLWCPEQEH